MSAKRQRGKKRGEKRAKPPVNVKERTIFSCGEEVDWGAIGTLCKKKNGKKGKIKKSRTVTRSKIKIGKKQQSPRTANNSREE